MKLLMVISAVTLLTACGTHKVDVERELEERTFVHSEKQTEEIRYTIYTDKEVYQEGEVIKAWTESMYVGEKEEIVIGHGGRIYYNHIKQLDGDFELEGAMVLPLLYTTLTKDIPHREDFVKTGAWDADSKENEFWEDFFADEDLMLPPGVYELIAEPSFHYSKEGKEVHVSEGISRIITVED
ncbi:hypothetical protein M3689_02830 [Alkalihalophilus marmarensis]|jgi:hypothetical protein|uniref:hypothetical protein n=1 Tax=Alkalihalophilus marmarensis TaxID=521377 RepID=UPI0020415812|nr:hypothetical protein [Alkalihalophilus marmarensis]MCM3488237.1 hypothetical protein [Alkalihalophilus marmarensis]